MLRITLIAVLVAVATANPFLVPKRDTRNIEGIVSCGSAGTLLDLSLTDTAGGDCAKVPCQIVVGHSYNIVAQFIPSASHTSMNVLATVTFKSDGHVAELVNTNLPIPVEGGAPYEFTYPWTVTGSLGKGEVTLHIEVGNDGVKELCGEADGNIVDA